MRLRSRRKALSGGFAGARPDSQIDLATSVQGATTFQALNGGTAITTAVDGGTTLLFVAGADVATVQAHTHFTLEDWRTF